MRHEVEQIIRQKQWSPEQIVGRFRLEGIPIAGKTTLYTFLHKDKEGGGDLYRHTRHHLKYRHKPLASPQKGKWGRRKSIDERPDCIDRKERLEISKWILSSGLSNEKPSLPWPRERRGMPSLKSYLMARMPSRWLGSLIGVWLTSRGWDCCIP